MNVNALALEDGSKVFKLRGSFSNDLWGEGLVWFESSMELAGHRGGDHVRWLAGEAGVLSPPQDDGPQG